MKEFVEKLIGMLEELKTFKLDLADAMSELMKKDRLDNYISKEEVVEIVNQLAEEYQTIDVADLVEEFGQKKVQSNAERIRAMSDEELATMLIRIDNRPISEYICFCTNKEECTELLETECIPEEMCKQCLIEWLQAEVEERPCKK